jgi:Asp-tRNA(Asn)/Glu-tRNA(Gln) amidotransferase A subunit family amidase
MTIEIASHGAEIGSAVEACMEHIRAFNTAYRAFSHLATDIGPQVAALQAELGAGRARSALHGVAVSIKGNIPVAGLPWTEGSAIYAGRMATQDAGIVARVRAAGGIIMGTTTLSELAMYGVENPFEPLGLNPWDITRTAGGSSTGAGVAAALGMAQAHIGTDSGGSIRNPACHCGVVGFMPRIGALTLAGKPNHAPSLSSVGLIARSVADVTTAFEVLREPAAASAPTAGGPRLLVLRQLIEAMCDTQTLALFAAALSRLEAAGFTLVDVDIPGWMEGERAAGVVSLSESGAALAGMDLTRASPGIRARAATAAKLSGSDVAAARAACTLLQRNVAETLRQNGADAIVTPTWPFAAPGIQTTAVDVQGRRVPVDPHRNCFVRAANAADACAITLPMGLYPGEGVPAGLQLMASGGSERELLAVAALAEAALPPMPLAPPLRAS